MIKRFVLYLLAAVLGVSSAAALSAVFMPVKVTGSGMEHNIDDGSVVLINKLAYDRGNGGGSGSAPKVGDVVAFHSDVHGEDGEGSILVRRVAGASGDAIEIKDDIFYLNGNPYEEYMTEAAHMEPMSRRTLGDGELFVLSDNRKSSMDSRNEAIGIIDSEECIGRVCFK